MCIYDISIISELNKKQSDWLRDCLYDTIFTTPGCECNIFETWLLSSPPLSSRQVNMMDSCWMNFSFIRKTSVQVQDILKDGEFSEWLLSPKSLSKTHTQRI